MDEGNRIELSKLCDIYLVLQLDKEVNFSYILNMIEIGILDQAIS